MHTFGMTPALHDPEHRFLQVSPESPEPSESPESPVPLVPPRQEAGPEMSSMESNRPDPRHAHSRTSVRERFAPQRQLPAQVQMRLCMAAASFVAVEGPRSLGHSLNDYVRAELGVRGKDFKRWLRMGRVLHASPQLREAFLEGHLGYSVVDLLARYSASVEGLESTLPRVCDKTVAEAEVILKSLSGVETSAGEASPQAPADGKGVSRSSGGHPPDRPGDRSPESDLVQISLQIPVPAARYVEETLDLASALLGSDVSEDQCVAAVLAEASTEIIPTLSLDEARRRPGALATSARKLRGGRFQSSNLPAGLTGALPRSSKSRRRAGHILHRWLRRLIDRHDRIEFEREDWLLEMYESGLHHRFGYPRFEGFASDALEIAPRTVWNRIQRARRRRSADPIARARTAGRIGAVQADMIERLHRRMHVPLRDLGSWIDLAESSTTQLLRRAIGWARAQRDEDYRAWSLGGCPPPSVEQLQTLNRTLEEIAAEPTPAGVAGWGEAPRCVLHLMVESEGLDLLRQLMLSLQQRARYQEQLAMPDWLALLRIFHLARVAWEAQAKQAEIPIAAKRRRVLERDRWQCRAPECSRRRNLQEHHIRYRSRGGGEEEENRITLCAFHHLVGIHGGLVRLSGRADAIGEDLHWEMGLDEQGRPHRVYRGERIVA